MGTARPYPRWLRLVGAGLAAAAAVTVIPGAVSAQPRDPIPSAADVERSRQKARAAATDVGRIEARLAQAEQRLEAAGTAAAKVYEAYNAAVYRLDQARHTAAQAERTRRRTSAVAEQARDQLGRLAATGYRTGGDLGALAVVLSADGPREAIDRAAFLSHLGRAQNELFLERARAQAAAERSSAAAALALAQQQLAAERVRQARERAQAQVEAQRRVRAVIANEHHRLSAQLVQARGAAALLQQRRETGLAELRRQAALRAVAARREAARRAAELRRHHPYRPPAGSAPSSPSSAAQRAVAYAYAQLGKPYEWAADGPDTFDCSGLTMRAWERGGVQLPHYSVAQYEQTRRIALSELRHGDLVFFGSDENDHGSIYHVGLYIGGGRMIEAPYTGENVRIASIWRDSLFGAGRP